MYIAAQAKQQFVIPVIGAAYGGGFFSGITVQDGKRYLNITASAVHELEGKWGEYGVKIEGAESFTDSRANTEAMAAAGSELAQQVLALNIGGFTDWAIPARDVQELQYRHFKPTTQENWANGRDGDNPNSEAVGEAFGISPAMAAEIVFMNDEGTWLEETPEERWRRMREWVSANIKQVTP